MLGEKHPLHIRALSEHARLESLFKAEVDENNLQNIETELNRHIRFEERELFRELQESLSEAKLRAINNKEEMIVTPDPDDWDDKFWQKKK